MTITNETVPTSSLDNRVPPPIAALLTAAAMWGVSHVGPIAGRTFEFRTPLVVTLGLAAAAFGASAFGAFRRASTTIDPVNIDRASSLVVSGVYRFTRNPMYVALTLLLTDWAIGLGAATAFAGPVLFALYITRFQIVPEERAMAAKFGDAYREYSARTRRWL